jgi:Trypsin-co-occurring domain 1
MARKLIEMESGDGGTILVAVEIPENAVGSVSRSDGDLPIEKVDRHFDAVRDLIIRGCYPLKEAFNVLRRDTQATDAEIEFGINFTAKGSVYVVESSGSASLKVKVTWKLDATDRSSGDS